MDPDRTTVKPIAEKQGGQLLVETGLAAPPWVTACSPPRFKHITAGFDNGRIDDATVFQRRVIEAFETIFREFRAGSGFYPVRFWAFLPGIHDDFDGGLDRYRAFNSARYDAFAAHFGRATSFGRSVPTASAVGVSGDRFCLHCLGATEAGLPIENPRQVSAYHYSRRFGPTPPCFARATLLRAELHEPMLLVGGTASITGEESRHIADLDAQARETFRNLASVVASASGQMLPEDASTTEVGALLQSFRELRVYFTDPAHKDALVSMVRAVFPPHCRIEWLQATLCRAELLVEIEGVAFPTNSVKLGNAPGWPPARA
jgi:hypothetical protein